MSRKKARQEARQKVHVENRSTERGPLQFAPWLRRSYANVPVTHDSALTLSTYWACVRAIASPLAHMSCHIRQLLPRGGSQIQQSHPADWVLARQANPETSSFTFRETLTAQALTWGNGYAEIETDGSGRLAWLWQITPDRVNPARVTDTGELVFDIANRHAPNVVLPASKVFHLKGLGFDGTVGYSVVDYARQSVGLGLATEKFGAEFFGNGLHPGGVAEMPGHLSPDGVLRLQTSLHEQVKRAHDVLILEDGLKWNTTTIPPEDAQFLQTREFQVPEMCRWFGVPPHKIYDLSRATFSNIEHQAIEYVTDSLVPWVERWEQEADVKLFGANRSRLYTKFNVAALLRGDLPSRYAAYAVGRQWGWLSVNDVRALEDMNPLPSHIGDTYMTPLNMMTLSLDPNAPPIGVPPKSPQTQPSPGEPEESNTPEGSGTSPLLMAALIKLLERDVTPTAPLALTSEPTPINLRFDIAAPQLSIAPPDVHTDIHLQTPERQVTVQVAGSTLHMPEQSIHVNNRVEPTQVTVPERQVNVNVAGAHVEMPAHNINIDNKLDVPERQVQVHVEGAHFNMPDHSSVNIENRMEVPERHINLQVEGPHITVPEREVTVHHTVENYLDVPERNVQVNIEGSQVHVPERPVHVQVEGAQISVPERQIHLQVEGTHVTVPEREVHVENRLDIPERQVSVQVEGTQITVPEREVRVENRLDVPERQINVNVEGARVSVPEQHVHNTVNVDVPERQVSVAVETPAVHIPQQSVHIDNRMDVPERAITLHVEGSNVTVPERDVTVNAQVQLPEQQVTVNIEGTQVTVPERDVRIENRVELPESQVTVNTAGPQIHIQEREVTVNNVIENHSEMSERPVNVVVEGATVTVTEREVHNTINVDVPERNLTVATTVEAAPPPPPTPITTQVHVEVPERSIVVENRNEQATPDQPITVNVEAPQIVLPEREVTVNIENSPRVDLPDTPVHVTVEAPTISVPERELTVNVEPQVQQRMQPVRLRDKIIRDAAGEIKHVVREVLESRMMPVDQPLQYTDTVIHDPKTKEMTEIIREVVVAPPSPSSRTEHAVPPVRIRDRVIRNEDGHITQIVREVVDPQGPPKAR